MKKIILVLALALFSVAAVSAKPKYIGMKRAKEIASQQAKGTMALDTKTHKVYLATAKFGEAPAPTTAQPRPRAPMIPNTFVILVYGK